MADVDIRDFLPLVMPHAPKLPVPLAIEHVRQAAVRFCTETRCWRHYTGPFAVTGNPTPIPMPVNAVVHEIEVAEFEGQTEPLEPASYRDFSLEDLHAAAGDAPPYRFTQENPDEIIIMPCKAGNLTLSLFLKPHAAPIFDGNAARNMLPDFIFHHHAHFIALGALSTALMLPDEAFMDVARAGSFAKQFEARIDAVRSDFRKGQQRRRSRTRSSPWLTTSSLGLASRGRRGRY